MSPQPIQRAGHVLADVQQASHRRRKRRGRGAHTVTDVAVKCGLVDPEQPCGLSLGEAEAVELAADVGPSHCSAINSATRCSIHSRRAATASR